MQTDIIVFIEKMKGYMRYTVAADLPEIVAENHFYTETQHSGAIKGGPSSAVSSANSSHHGSLSAPPSFPYGHLYLQHSQSNGRISNSNDTIIQLSRSQHEGHDDFQPQIWQEIERRRKADHIIDRITNPKTKQQARIREETNRSRWAKRTGVSGI
ncbi:uncharacterized protein PV07_02408 [Cladophialophora immunda]|uniref:Uncharacterized protein n=1 Tax=Cladophialophora immunda TaxID=569365 RepID=A0A0D2CKV3_9EURO|nr:uncharacterized protein PV07_02408 [Cladophialophora immunda]KIW30700.1 hypothetical protein PV07_02408 [Cladophialophora immunda]